MSRRIARRTLLRGLGGALVAAPVLSSLGRRGARAAAVPPSARLIAMFTHYGCVTTRFFPEKAHGELLAADLEATTLAPLAPFASKLLLPRGIRAMNEWTATLARGQGNDPHIQASSSYFTCHPITPNSDDPFSFSMNTRFQPKAMDRSLDHVMAEQLSPDGIPLFLRVSGRSDAAQSVISYSAPETYFPGIGSTTQALAQLTGLFDSGTALSPDSYRVARGQSVLDIVAGDLERLEGFDMSLSDRHKLEAWKELLHETGAAVAEGACSQGFADELGVGTDSALSPADMTEPVVGSLDAADLYSNIAVLTAACNANPVVFLKYPGNYVYSGLGLTIEHHGLSHRNGNAGWGGECVDGVMEMLLSIDAYHARKFAHLVTQLDSVNDGDGTLLDTSAAVWFQEMSDGIAHNLNNLPIVQAGGASGYFKTGVSVNVADGDPALTRGNSELWCTDAASSMVSSTEISDQLSGTPAELASAPINKYFCNLMNALGVKAGEDGFPLLGGQAEVTHYGMYDKTEDFIGGGTNPPTIHDPGEFTALRA
jgi:hypothetical protein